VSIGTLPGRLRFMMERRIERQHVADNVALKALVLVG
jgi:hypothetical protein